MVGIGQPVQTHSRIKRGMEHWRRTAALIALDEWGTPK
jgi:hypothetical protein